MSLQTFRCNNPISSPTHSRLSLTISPGVYFVVRTVAFTCFRSLRRRRVAPASSGFFDPARLTETTLYSPLLWCQRDREMSTRRGFGRRHLSVAEVASLLLSPPERRLEHQRRRRSTGDSRRQYRPDGRRLRPVRADARTDRRRRYPTVFDRPITFEYRTAF